ncbi:MAG: hypothetical protein JW995_10580 [Melioribacteraceae bacterium]|nr:hypothetical protein [Melioribacteraceae bacterium]
MDYEKEYEIHYYHCEADMVCSIHSIVRFFEDIAIQQSENLGVGVEFYNSEKVGWMLSRWLIDIDRLPEFREKIKIITTPKAFSGFYANREYIVIDSGNQIIIKATTLWIFVNLDTRRPARINQKMFDAYAPSERDMQTFTKLEEVSSPELINHSKQFRIRRNEIDTNGHTNNSHYITWALETLPESILNDKKLSKLTVNYLKETNFNDVIESSVQIDIAGSKYRCLHLIQKDDTPVCKIESVWI